jgi:hypothetical protein
MPFTALAEDIGLGVFPLGAPVGWLLESGGNARRSFKARKVSHQTRADEVAFDSIAVGLSQ